MIIYLICLISSMATLIGCSLMFLPKRYEKGILSFSLGLSFSVMFFISVFELIPEGIKLGIADLSFEGLYFSSLLMLFIGYAIVKILDIKLIKGEGMYKVGILSSLSLFLHNVPEGIICALSMMSNFSLGLKMSLMILIHNIPEGICISLPIYYSTGQKGKAYFYAISSSIGEFVGAFITLTLFKGLIDNVLLFMMLLITAGVMISISLLKLLREGLICNKVWFIVGGMIGFVIVFVTL